MTLGEAVDDFQNDVARVDPVLPGSRRPSGFENFGEWPARSFQDAPAAPIIGVLLCLRPADGMGQAGGLRCRGPPCVMGQAGACAAGTCDRTGSVWQFRCIGRSGLGLRVAAEAFFLQGGEAAGGAIDLAGEADLTAVHVGEEEALVRHVGEGDGGADGLVEGTEFFLEGRGVAVHLEVDGGGLGLPGAAEAPLGGDDFVHEEALEGSDGVPEGEVFGLDAFVFGLVLIAEDEDAGVDAVGDGVAR